MLAYTFSGNELPVNCGICPCHWCSLPLVSRGDRVKKQYMDKRHKDCPLQVIKEPYYCTVCGGKCYESQSPEVVFKTETDIICENCSIDYEEIEGNVFKIDSE